MPALFFPTHDALRLVLASGIVPAGVTRAPAAAGLDAHGRLWLEPPDLPREVLTALARVGVKLLGGHGVVTAAVGCWAELLLLRTATPRPETAVLYDLPDARLAGFVREVRRAGPTALGISLPDDPPGRALVTTRVPVPRFPIDPATDDIEAFVECASRVWVRAGWEHPLPEQLVVPPGELLQLRPGEPVARRPHPLPIPREDEYTLPVQPVRRTAPPDTPPPIAVRFTLKKCGPPTAETLWVFADGAKAEFWEFCGTADEAFVRRFAVAVVGNDTDTRLVVRATGKRPAELPLPGRGYAPDAGVPGLFVPAGFALRPALRPADVAQALDLRADRVTWAEPGNAREVVTHAVPATAFRPAGEWMKYAVPRTAKLTPADGGADPFPLPRYALIEDSLPFADTLDEEPRVVPHVPTPPPTPGWLERSFDAVARRVGDAFRAAGECLLPTRFADEPPAKLAKPRTPAVPPEVRPQLASADALVHGPDRTTRRQDLEARLLDELPRLEPARRAVRWAELAETYDSVGNPADAAVCWINAIWDADPPPAEWPALWLAAECRAARQPASGMSLDRWLSAPGRFGAGRVVAAYAVWAATRPQPPAELTAALPRMLAFLDHHFDDLPARAAWLARSTLSRLSDGDNLGLARWRDRVIARLREKGPGLDLDEPSFLRFHGTASADRFQTAREWLARARDPILAWVNRLGPGGKLQWAGLDAETECTAAYAQLLLAWGLGCLGERTRSRDWAARSRKVLSRANNADPTAAVHAALADLFQSRIRDAQDGRPPRPGVPTELRERYDRLGEFPRYAVDRLRAHSRVLEPVDRVRAFRGRELREFWGADQLGERLFVMADSADPAHLTDEARHLLAACAADATSHTVPRVTFTLLEVAPLLADALIPELLGNWVPALDWLETWLQTGRWTEIERAAILPRLMAQLLESGFAAAARSGQWAAASKAAEYLTRRAATDPAARAAVGLAARTVFRSLRKLGLRNEAEVLLRELDPDPAGAADLPPATRLGLAVGWFAVGHEDDGNRILNAARDRLYLAGTPDDRGRTDLAIAYAEALGSAAPRIALGRLEEIFQRLDRVTLTGGTNRYFTLKPLELIDAVVRAVVSDDFALGPAVRGWLDDDEFLIRRRIHRDMAAALKAGGIG